MAKFFYNTNPKYGDAGPHECNDMQELVYEIEPNIREWIAEEVHRGDLPDDVNVEAEVEKRKREFLGGLDEVAND